MALRTDLPKIPADREPTIWNRNMGAWAFCFSLIVGTIAAPLIGVMFPPTSFVPTIIGFGITAIGGLIGGFRQKAEMQKELVEGKTVKDPTFWNSKILSNALAVSIPVGLATTAAMYGLGVTPVDVINLVIEPGSLTPEVAKNALAIFTTEIMGGIASIVSGIMGGFSQKAQMQKEFDQAIEIKQSQERNMFRGLEQQIDRGMSRGISQSRGEPYVNSVPKDLSQLLESRMKGESGPRSFAQEHAARREAATQAPAEVLT